MINRAPYVAGIGLRRNMKRVGCVFLAVCGMISTARSQDVSRFGLFIGSARSFASGDENIYGAFQWPMSSRFHGTIHGGWRSTDPKTLAVGSSVGFGLYGSSHHRLYANTDLTLFRRVDYFPFDDHFWRHTVGIGYSTKFWRRFILNTEVNPIGFYYGTRNDPQPGWKKHPNLIEAGEVRFALGFIF